MISGSDSDKCHSVKFVAFKKHSIVIGKEIAINPKTKKPFVVWFVNNTSSGGDGTFESPFDNLAAVQAAASEYDIIYIYPGNGTDTPGLTTGLVPLRGQAVLGAGLTYKLKAKQGWFKIPPQASGIPTLSNTNSPNSNPILMQFGENTVAGLNLVDNVGGATRDDFLDQSGGARINGGSDYLISENSMSTFNNAALPQPGGIGLTIFGGGDVKAVDNKFVGRDSLNAVTFGVWMRSAVNPFSGYFKFKGNLFTGADNNSGLNAGFVIAIRSTTSPPPTFGNSGNLKLSIKDNVFNSQSNTSNDHGVGVFINSFPMPSTSVRIKVKGNKVTIPAGITQATAGIQIIGNGPGKTEAVLHENVSLTIPPVPGYIFAGSPANLDLDVGYDNFGTSSGP